MDERAHWEHVYTTKSSDKVSWYQAVPTRSLELLESVGAGPDTAIIDVGGGDSTLVDALTERGIGSVTVLDLSASALARARHRIGERASAVAWIEGDIRSVNLGAARYDVWHDRAVFHFLTVNEDRQRYVDAAARAIRPGGALIIGTFALDGPTRCSGLEVARYSADELAAQFAEAFELERSYADTHESPAGATQRFTFVVLRHR